MMQIFGLVFGLMTAAAVACFSLIKMITIIEYRYKDIFDYISIIGLTLLFNGSVASIITIIIHVATEC